MHKIFNNSMWFMALVLVISITGCRAEDDKKAGMAMSLMLLQGAGSTVPGAGTGVGGLGVGPAPVELLTVKTNDFVILTKTGITNVHTSAITGNIGSSPITAAAMDNVFCSEITGTIYGVNAAYVGSGDVGCFSGNPPLANKTLVDNAVLDMGTAYTDAEGRTLPDYTELHAGNISGMTLAPGLYKWGTGVLITTGVTLKGGPNDVWIFQIAQDLIMSSGARITLSGGALPQNIYWQVFGIVDIGTTAHFEGIALVKTAITLKTGATANGRLLAQTAVTLDANTVTKP